MPVPVLTLAQMREWEAISWRAGRSISTVISLAGTALARQALRMTQPGDSILVLAGKGNNGADAKRAIEHLADRRVRLLEISDPAPAREELAVQLASPTALVMDGLFGIGLNRPLDAYWVELLEQVNLAGHPVLAVDVPSGLCADTGRPLPVAIRAHVTLTLGAPKAGCLTPSASPFVGRLELAADIGLVPCPASGELLWTLPGDFAGLPPARPVDSHKGSWGHVTILAGSTGYHGAAVLAARGALAARPGLVSVITPPAVYVPVASQLQAAMVHPCSAGALQRVQQSCAFVIGPGLAGVDVTTELKEAAAQIWRQAAGPVLADASALDWLPLREFPTRAIRVITPHPGEAARLLDCDTSRVQADRCNALRQLTSSAGGSWVVLKGRHTLIGATGGPIWVNPSGNPMLSQGGSGDVLAGFLGGLLAQPWGRQDAGQTLRFGVWHHGDAADRLSQRRAGWGMEELLGAL